jgi:protein-L-isoaspartate(D-aspartate) O-methyltransferase
MTDFAAARRTMVDGQLRTFDVTDQNVLAAVLAVPRERFVPVPSVGIAYLDSEIVVGGHGQRRMLKPMVFAKMLQAAAILPSDHVLDIGSGTGYSAAVIGKLCDQAVALEEDLDLARHARQNLASVGAANVTVAEGPLGNGWPARAPYDVIVLNGAAETVPPALFDQLKPGGRLVAIVGGGPAPKVTVYRQIQGQFSGWPVFDASGPVLPGFSRPQVFQF